MAQQRWQFTFSAASNGAQRNRRRSQRPQGSTSVFSVFARQSFRHPAYQYHNNYQDFIPYEAYAYTYGFNYYNTWNHAPSIMPPTRGNNGYHHQITNLETYSVLWMQRGGYVQEDETWVLDGIGQETEEDAVMLGDGCLSEEVVSKYLKTRKGNHKAVGKEKDEEPKICVVCQDNLYQENLTIGVLDCGHEFHACCIKKWLQRKNVCPLCKAVAMFRR